MIVKIILWKVMALCFVLAVLIPLGMFLHMSIWPEVETLKPIYGETLDMTKGK